MQSKEEFEQTVRRFLDEAEKRLQYAEKCDGISGELIVSIHPEIYANVIGALEVINKLGESRNVRIERIENRSKSQNCELKFKRLPEKK